MSQRYVRFNVNELARIAAEAVGAKSYVSVKKYPNSMYNKAMFFTMGNRTLVVAKVPNPNAGKLHFTTASEVAQTTSYLLLACNLIIDGEAT